MLVEFKAKAVFNATRMSLWVNQERKEIDLVVVHQARIVPASSSPNYEDVDTPEKADRWMIERIESVHQTLRINGVSQAMDDQKESEVRCRNS